MNRKGIFIPDITVEMFRNATLESVEDLMANGQMEDIEIPERPQDDLISREWLKDAFDNLCCHSCKTCRNFRNEDSFYKCNLIENAPTEEPDRRGEWIQDDDLSFDPARPWWYCSHCGERTGIKTKYCSECGFRNLRAGE